MLTAVKTQVVYNRSAAEQPPEKQLLPITPNLHLIINATAASTTSITDIKTISTATTMTSSLIYVCGTVVVI
jgi:hypothetical protein